MANDVTIRVRVKDQLSGEIGGIASNLITLMGGAVVPLTGAVAALGAELAGAGAAAAVFGAAVAPQLASVKQLATEQDAYNKAVAEYGADSSQAATAQKKFQGDMAALTPSTREAAKSFIDLKSKFSAWSDSLSSSTMPVFTHAMNGLKNVFPLLTPLVKDVSAQFLQLSTRFEAFSKTDKFKDLVSQFNTFASGALKNVISGMEKMAKAIGSFVVSPGFKDFMAQGKEALPGLAKALQDLAEFVGKFIKAAGPLGGLQLKVFEILADTLNKIPTDVLETLVPLLAGAAISIKAVKFALMGFEFIKGLILGFQLLTGATLELDAAMDANPVGLVVIALAALAFGLIYAWNHCKTFRLVVEDTFDAVKLAGAFMVHMVLIGLKGLADGFFLVAGQIVHGASIAFGWVPGLGGKLKAADKWFGDFTKSVDGKFDAMISKSKQWETSATNSMRERKLKADISDWNNKLESAKKKLKSVPDSKKAKIRGDITDLQDKIFNAKAKINALHGKTITFTYRTVGYIPSAAQVNALSHANRATGGVIGAAASGGVRSGLTMVGENGPELVHLPIGSTVRSNPDTQRALSGFGGGGSAAVHVTLQIGDKAVGELVIDPLRKVIRAKGENVQAVLGK